MTREPGPEPQARVCVLTPGARGAIAVVRLWGLDALDVADRVFVPSRGGRLIETAPGTLRFGRVGGEAGDEVVAVVITSEPPEVEIHCHGGTAAVAMVVQALVDSGAERRRPVAWVVGEGADVFETEARVDLARATTVRTAEVLLEQSQGALGQALPGLVRLIRDDTQAALVEVEDALRRGRTGLKLVPGWKVALAGRPNVGKSRLFNALAGYARAIVAATPGTTRDALTVRTAIDGWPVELADTAGLRESDDPIEAAGVAVARSRHSEADLTLFVLDRSEPLTAFDRLQIAGEKRHLIVANKSDLPAMWEAGGTEAVEVSAERGDGLETLLQAVARRLVPDPPGPGAWVPFRPRHLRCLRAVREALRSGGSTDLPIALLGELTRPKRDAPP